MARIQTYTTDNTITGNEKVIGTDTDNSTKNYTIDEIGDYIEGGLARIWRANAAIYFGVIHISALQYSVWCKRFIINQVDYSIITQDTITLSNGETTLNRIDLIILRLDATLTTATIEVVEGTPAEDPLEPSLDYRTEVLLSRRVILAGAVTDPDVTSDMIYNDNAEWTNTALPTGADLDDLISPYIGTKSLNIPTALTGAVTTTWDKGSAGAFNIDDTLVFAIRRNTIGSFNAVYTFTLFNSVNSDTRTYVVSLAELLNFGMDTTSTAWQLISIPLLNFVGAISWMGLNAY
jgi:hypothetical protein